MLKRRTFAGGLAAALAAPTIAHAQQPGRVRRVGFLATNDPIEVPSAGKIYRGFNESMAALGWVEGRNLHIEYRYARGQLDRFPALVAELVGASVEVILAGGSVAVDAARRTAPTIPIVFPYHTDPLATGVVASLARPGGRITGLSIQSVATDVKGFDLLLQALPGRQQVSAFWGVANPGHLETVNALRRAAAPLGVAVNPIQIGERAALPAAFERIEREGLGPLLVFASTRYFGWAAEMAALALKHRVPLMTPSWEYAQAGALMSYGPDYADLMRRSAKYVDRILRGANPGDLPVEQAERFELFLNLKTAKALGIQFPPSILVRADEAIE